MQQGEAKLHVEISCPSEPPERISMVPPLEITLRKQIEISKTISASLGFL